MISSLTYNNTRAEKIGYKCKGKDISKYLADIGNKLTGYYDETILDKYHIEIGTHT